ncbi:MAG: hypothetical protein ACR2IE_20155 [Candidatus Sumerlaeaceae bacterium]
MDASQIWMANDVTNVYFFIQGRVDAPNPNSGLLFLINTSNLAGVAAGTSLGGVAPVTTHIFSNTNDAAFPLSNSTVNWKMDFETDRAWFGSPVSSSFSIDKANYDGIPGGAFLGTSSLAGNIGVFGGESHAFNNGSLSGGPGSSTGWEMSIPRANLGGIVDAATVEAYAIVATSSASFSDDASPGTFVGNAGFNPDFNASPYAATMEHGGAVPVPVIVSQFSIE